MKVRGTLESPFIFPLTLVLVMPLPMRAKDQAARSLWCVHMRGKDTANPLPHPFLTYKPLALSYFKFSLFRTPLWRASHSVCVGF